MNNKNLFVLTFIALTIAFLTVACDFGTANWPTDKPRAPFSLSAKMTEDRKGVILRWSAPESGDEVRGYEIYRWIDVDSVRVLDAVFRGVRDTQYVDTTRIVAGSILFYSVNSYNGAGVSDIDTSNSRIPMAWIVIPPLAAQNLTATALNSYQIQTNWSAVAGAIDYHVYRSENADFSNSVLVSTLSRIPGDNLAHIDSLNLKPHTTYYYKILSDNSSIGGDIGVWSNIAVAKTKLAPPCWVSVKIQDDNSVVIRWTAVVGAVGYHLYYGSGLANPIFDYLIANDEKGKPSVFTRVRGAAPAPDTLQFIDDGFVDIQPGARVFYKACGIEVFAPSGDYKKDIVGDKSAIGKNKDGTDKGFDTKK